MARNAMMSAWMGTFSIVRPQMPQWLERLCRRLTDNDPTLTTLEVTSQRINDSSAIALAKALQQNTTVTSFVISLHSIVDDGVLALGVMLRNNRTIKTLQLRDIRDERTIVVVTQAIGTNTTITELRLRHCSICRRGAQAISMYLSRHTTIQELRLVDCRINEADAVTWIVKGLQQNSSLQRVYMINNGMESSARAAASLGNMLRKNKCLRELHLCENTIGDDGVRDLAQGLMENSTLGSINLRSNNITPVGAMELFSLLHGNKSITKLNLGSNRLGNKGTAMLCSALAENTVLETLDLSDNRIEENGAEALANMLLSNQVLQELDLSCNEIGDEGATAIANVLDQNQSLRWLSIRRNKIDNIGTSAFARKLPTMRGLTELIMVKNCIDDEGKAMLLEGIKLNMQLEYLGVDDSASEPVLREMMHWTRLNRAGRRIFRETNLSAGLWPWVFAKVNPDPTVLFHFLNQKPEVFVSYENKQKVALWPQSNE